MSGILIAILLTLSIIAVPLALCYSISWLSKALKRDHQVERNAIRQSANKLTYKNSQKEIEVFTYDRETGRLGCLTRERHFKNWSLVSSKLIVGPPTSAIEDRISFLESLNVEPTIDCVDYK